MSVGAQDLVNFRSYDKNGINVFEPSKDTTSTSNDVKVKIGGAFALQFQSIKHENSGNVALFDLGNNFNLATANLAFDVRLYDGVNLNLTTYLSSRHHPEPYVKGGYLQIDKLDFIKEGFLADFMQYATIKVGHMENNYGDSHFRRSDNALAIYNPFVGNYIMDAFTTEVGAEVYYRRGALISMIGITNGRLNQTATGGTSPSTIIKLGYDKQFNEDLRFRLTGSMYHTAQSTRTYLYAGDRAGSRYYFVMEEPTATSKDQFTSGRFNPGFNNKLTAFMFNPFLKYKGFEYFGLLEFANGKNATETSRRNFTQFGSEILYRFGNSENFYVGARYNSVSGELDTHDKVKISRFNLGGGWFMTKNIMTKIEYVNQKYTDFPTASKFDKGKFSGFVAEAVIAF